MFLKNQIQTEIVINWRGVNWFKAACVSVFTHYALVYYTCVIRVHIYYTARSFCYSLMSVQNWSELLGKNSHTTENNLILIFGLLFCHSVCNNKTVQLKVYNRTLIFSASQKHGSTMTRMSHILQLFFLLIQSIINHWERKMGVGSAW